MPEAQPDVPPPVGVGHLSLAVADLAASHRFYTDLGLRSFGKGEAMAVLELRGGTHLLLFQEGGPAGDDEGPFDKAKATSLDLMIAGRSLGDLTAFRDAFAACGHAPDPILDRQYFGHFVFKAKDPDGNEVTVSTSHASNLPI
jgi:catechol 2,3-dioxygenase-like lactoylglutathione lyase family enzyme